MMKNRKAKGIHEWKAKEAAKGAHASRIQSFFRGALQRRRLALWKEASAVVQAQVRGLVERKADRRRRTGVKRLQRVFRGAKVRQRLMKMAQALVLIQRTLRGYVTRMRLQRRKMRKKRVVHSAAAIRRLLASAVKLHEVMDSNSGDYPITWTQYRDTNTDKVFYLRTEHLKYADQTDTRWEAPECFRGRFVCGFDDLGEDGVCEERFDSEFEVETHRKQVHQWDCDACFWHNHWREWPKCAMCGNEYVTVWPRARPCPVKGGSSSSSSSSSSSPPSCFATLPFSVTIARMLCSSWQVHRGRAQHRRPHQRTRV